MRPRKSMRCSVRRRTTARDSQLSGKTHLEYQWGRVAENAKIIYSRRLGALVASGGGRLGRHMANNTAFTAPPRCGSPPQPRRRRTEDRGRLAGLRLRSPARERSAPAICPPALSKFRGSERKSLLGNPALWRELLSGLGI